MIEIITRQYKGDPFLTLVKCGGVYYVFDESALIEQQEELYRKFFFDYLTPRNE
jgi:hypothetical protein